MRPNMTLRAQGPTVYVDANPLSEKHLTGIGRYTARICLALAARGARVRFFVHDRELLPPRGLDWSQDQDLGRWGSRVWHGGRLVPLAAIPDNAVGLWTWTRPCERTFPVELSILHDLTPLIVRFRAGNRWGSPSPTYRDRVKASAKGHSRSLAASPSRSSLRMLSASTRSLLFCRVDGWVRRIWPRDSPERREAGGLSLLICHFNRRAIFPASLRDFMRSQVEIAKNRSFDHDHHPFFLLGGY